MEFLQKIGKFFVMSCQIWMEIYVQNKPENIEKGSILSEILLIQEHNQISTFL